MRSRDATPDVVPEDDTSTNDATADAAVCVPKMIAWWKGDNDTSDQMGAIPLTTADEVWYSDAEVANGFHFAPNRPDAARLLEGNASPLNGLSTFTIEAWVTYEGPSYEGSPIRSTILSRGPFDGDASGVEFVMRNTYLSGSVELWVGPRSVASDLIAQNFAPFHVAATYESGGTARIYVGGSLSPIGADAGPIVADAPLVRVGGRSSNEPSTWAWGLIDELAIYNVALTPAQIKTIVAAGTKGKTTVLCP